MKPLRLKTFGTRKIAPFAYAPHGGTISRWTRSTDKLHDQRFMRAFDVWHRRNGAHLWTLQRHAPWKVEKRCRSKPRTAWSWRRA